MAHLCHTQPMVHPAHSLASVDFAARNTPLQQCDRLAKSLGLAPGQFWVKRDDMTGLAGGGNKARKLELLVAEAIAAGATTLVTGGAAQSNHVRATAAAARAVDLECVAVLAEPTPPTAAEGNLILDDLLGATVVWTTREERHEALTSTVAALAASGRVPFSIPLGGSSTVGASAYALCAEEITSQLGSDMTTVCAVGSGGTMAGLVNGLGSNDRVLGFDVVASPTMAADLVDLVEKTAEFLGRELSTPWRLEQPFVDVAYGEPNDAVFDAIRLVAETTGLVLDPVYSGRAMAGLIALLSGGWQPETTPIVFVHTGGMPALFTRRYADRFSVPSPMQIEK